jgi:general secretion pathway protein B
MSSILKALEKAEESNSTKRSAGDSGLIRSRRSRPVWVMPTAVLGGAVVAALATFAAMGGFSRHAPVAQAPAVLAKADPVVVAPAKFVSEKPVATPAPSAAPAAIAPTAVAPAAPAPTASAGANPKAAPAANLKVVQPQNPKAAPLTAKAVTMPAKVVPATAKAIPAQPGKTRTVTSTAPQPAGGRAATPQPAVVQAAPVPEPAPVAAAAPHRPELKVSGIAWQNNGESSFAVVNGRAVLQGGTVDGYKVLEIQRDAVKFSGANGITVVPLGDEEK